MAVWLCAAAISQRRASDVEKGPGLLDSPPLQPHVDRQATEFLQSPFPARGAVERLHLVYWHGDLDKDHRGIPSDGRFPGTGDCRTDKPRMGNGIPR